MARLQVTVCDECGVLGKPTTRYQIASGTRKAVMDLCADDARDLEKVLTKHGAKAAKREPFSARVTTPEALEERKKAKP